jgi:hypothetical protein
MYAVTLQTSARKTDIVGYFADESVANHVAGLQSGFDAGEGPAAGVVTAVDIDMSTSVEEYEANLAAAAELTEREQWAAFYEDLSDEQKALMAKFAPASLTAGV